MSPISPDSLTTRRVNILAYPAPTTGRYLVFLLALLTSGLFVGNWMHNQVVGDVWADSVLICQSEAGRVSGGSGQQEMMRRGEFLQACKAPHERSRAVWSLGGAAVVGAGALLVMYVSPGIVRRRRRFSPPGPNMRPVVQRFNELSAGHKLKRAPALVIGPLEQLDAFSFGAPGRYTVVLPKAVAVKFRDPAVFDAVVRHELAHIKHRDVAYSWMARSTWYVLGPVLLLPVLWSLVERDFSLLGSYLWRALALAAVVEVVAAGLLRAREYDADLKAASGAIHLEHMRACLQGLPDRKQGKGFRRYILARHPRPARRREVLESPWIATRIGFSDATTAGFLAALSAPLIVGALIPLLTGTGLTVLAGVSAALLVGSLLGSSVGLGLWRLSAVTRATRAFSPSVGRKEFLRGSPSVAGAAMGVSLGLVLGLWCSFAQTGLSQDYGIEMLMPLVVGAGAVGLSAALGEVWAGALALMDRAVYGWGIALVVNCVLFSAAAWLWDSLWALLTGPGWPFARVWLATSLGALPMLAAIMLVLMSAAAGLLLLARSAGREPPKWLFEVSPLENPTTAAPADIPGTDIRTVVSAGLIAGIIVAAVPPLWRLIAGTAPTAEAAEQRVMTTVWMCAGAWGIFMVSTALFRSRFGPVAAVVGGFLATGVGGVGFLLYNLLIGGSINAALVGAVLPPAIGLGFLFMLVGAGLLPFIPPVGPGPGRVRALPFHLFTAAATALMGAAAVGLAPVLIGSVSDMDAAAGAPTLNELAEVEKYADELAPLYLDNYQVFVQKQRAAQAAYPVDPLGGVAQLRNTALPVLTDLRTQVESLKVRSQPLEELHNELLEAIKIAEQGLLLEAEVVESLDSATISTFFSVTAADLQAKELEHLNRWAEGLVTLRQSLRNP